LVLGLLDLVGPPHAVTSALQPLVHVQTADDRRCVSSSAPSPSPSPSPVVSSLSLLRRPCSQQSATIPAPRSSLSLSPLVLATCFYSILPSLAATHTRILFAEFYENLEHVLGNFGAVRATKIAQRVGRTLAAFSGVLLWRQVG
jgi:hypothetical protein